MEILTSLVTTVRIAWMLAEMLAETVWDIFS